MELEWILGIIYNQTLIIMMVGWEGRGKGIDLLCDDYVWGTYVVIYSWQLCGKRWEGVYEYI